tara:strand:+ start:473 stop:1027 length:555 start_codon:yes stop_codon:yes gene_type:complete
MADEEQEQEQEQEPRKKKKLGYVQIGFMWWFHPINGLIYILLFTMGMLVSGAFSYAVQLERTALRNVIGNDLAISHKDVLFEGYGYRIVRERTNPAGKYSPGEILVNRESRQEVDQAEEGERFERAARIGAIKAKAYRYSDRREYANRAMDNLNDEGIASADEPGLDLGDGVNLNWGNQVDYED